MGLREQCAGAESLSRVQLCDPMDCIVHGVRKSRTRLRNFHFHNSITMNKASGGDGIPAELFQILKDDDVKVLYTIRQQIWGA